MFEIKIEKKVQADISEVFEMLIQHEKYKQFRVISHSSLIKKGEFEENGLGAKREIVSNSFKVVEDIVAFDRPNHLGYKIVQSKPFNIEHLLGDIRLESIDNGQTLVKWLSKGRVTTPLLGWYFDKKMNQNGPKVLSSILKDIEAKLNT